MPAIYSLIIFSAFLSVMVKGGKIGLFGSPMPKLIRPTMPVVNATRRISVPVFLHFGGMYGAGSLLTESIKIALDTVTESGILNGTELNFELFDTQCSWSKTSRAFLEQVTDFNTAPNDTTRIPLVLGPVCGDSEVTGPLLQHYNFTGITALAVASKLYRKRGLYKNYNIMMPSPSSFYIALPYFLEANGWKRVFYISDGRDDFREYDSSVMEGCQRLNISIDSSYKLPYDSGSLGAPMEQIHESVRELKKRDARVVVFNSFRITHIACTLYHYGMYGPGYTFIMYGVIAFRPDTRVRLFVEGLNCTEEHLYQVLKSVIFYGISNNANVNPERPDSFGMTTGDFEEKMKERIIEPEKSYIWWYYRTSFYDMVTVAGKALQSVVGDGEITAEKLQQSIERVDFKGLFTDMNRDTWNLPLGRTAFYQVQTIDSVANDDRVAYSDKLVNVPVAVFQPEESKLVLGPKRLRWRTSDGLPPRDTLLVKRTELPPIQTSWSVALLVLSILNFGVISICFYFHYKFIEKVVLLIGTVLLMISVVIYMVGSIANVSHFNHICMVGSVFNVAGISIVSIVYYEIQRKILLAIKCKQTQSATGSIAGILATRKKLGNMASRISKISPNFNPNFRSKRANCFEVESGKGFKLCRLASIPTVLSAIAIAWFILEPLKNFEINGPLVNDPVEISVQHQNYSLYCQPGEKSIYFIAAILISLALVSLTASFFNLSIPQQHSDRYRNVVKLSWNMILITVIAGAIATVAFFMENIVEACSLINIFITFIVFCLLLTVKSKNRMNNRFDSLTTRRQ